MIAAEIKLIAAVAALAGAFAGGWMMQGWRMDGEIERMQHDATKSQLSNAGQAIQKLADNQKGLTDALAKFHSTQQANAKNQAELGALLRDVRGTAAGLRGDFADLPGRINTASNAALGEYATACTAVFERLAAAGGRLAESGADLARSAAGHAADEQMMRDAWPKR